MGQRTCHDLSLAAKALKRRGHNVRFIEKDVEWYRSNRDMPQPGFCTVQLYNDWNTDAKSWCGQVLRPT